MREIVFTRRFERDFRRLKRELPRHVLDYETLEYVFGLLQTANPLPGAFREHALQSEYAGFTECHMDADWLLIYRVTGGLCFTERECIANCSGRGESGSNRRQASRGRFSFSFNPTTICCGQAGI